MKQKSTATRRVLLGAAAALGTAPLARPALTQPAWRPTRPVRLIVPFPPGGATDMLARLIGQGLGDRLGQTLVVENRPGGTGVVATLNVMSAPADGHTVLLATADTHTVMALANNRLPYRVSDFVPVSGIASVVFSLVARPGLPVTDLQSFLRLARSANPPLNYASYGYASVSHAAGEMLKMAAGIDMTHVPFQGAAPGVVAITANQVDVMMVPVAVAQPQRSQLKMLAVADAERFSLVPDVPTLKEQGLDVTADAWIGILAAPHTPPAVAEALHAAVKAVQDTPAFQETLRTNGFSSRGYGPREFAAYLNAENERWGQVVRAAHISVEG
ncbi:MAG TPA: tripartite tricarboxylate transporter substrate binding protein [Roseomonas sp.]|jgi:tripartite-type tricarboxylate transporter receptor subunit TctC